MKSLHAIIATFLAIDLTFYFSAYISPVYLPEILISLPVLSCLDLESFLGLFFGSHFSFTWEEFKTGIEFLENIVMYVIFTVLIHYHIQCNFI